MKSVDIVLEPGSPAPKLILRDQLVHDPTDPLGQARAWVSAQVTPEVDLVAVLGLGLGHHLQALRERRPRARLIVLEPFDQVREIFQAHGLAGLLDDPAVRLTGSLDEFKQALVEEFVYGPGWLKLGQFTLPAYRAAAPDLAAEAAGQIKQLVLRRGSNLKTILRRQDEFLNNLSQNFGPALELFEATAARDSLAGRPAVIVAAGPSLPKSLPELKEHRDKLAVLAVGTVFKRLVEEGIVPDAVVVIEARDVSEQISGEPALASTLLALSSLGHPAHLNHRAEKTLVFHPKPWIARLFGDLLPVPDGGNVASSAFTLAFLWGADPIILLGQDLAYEKGRLYTEGARSPVRRIDPRDLTPVPGNLDQEVLATSELISYRSWYEESARYLARVRPELKLVNATAGGARIEGFQRESLAQAVAGLTPLEPSAKARLLAALAGTGHDLDLVRRRLAEFRREAARLAGLAQDEARPLEEVMTGLKESFLLETMTHLVGPPPAADKTRQEVRAELVKNTQNLERLAVMLQDALRAKLGG